MSKYIKKIVTALWYLLLVTMFALLAAFGITQVPAAQRFAARKAAEGLSGSLGLPVSVERLRYVPFSAVEVSRLSIADADSAPMVSVGRVKADVSLPALFGGRISLREVDADSVTVVVSRRADGRLNVADFAQADSASPSPGPSFSIGRILARHCAVTYDGGKSAPVVFESVKLDASRLRKTEGGFGASVANLSFFYPSLDSHFALGGDFAVRGDTIAAGGASVSFGGMAASADTLLAVVGPKGLTYALVEIPKARANGFTASRMMGRDIPPVSFALSATYESERLNLSHLRLSVGDKTSAEAKGASIVRLDADGLHHERSTASVSGWLSLADIKPFLAPDAEWPDIPRIPFNGSLTATLSDASAALNINSDILGQARLYASAATADAWATADFNIRLDADITPQSVTGGKARRLVTQASSHGRVARTKEGGESLRYVTLNGDVQRADVGDLSVGGIRFDGVGYPGGLSGKLTMDDPLGSLLLVAEAQWDGVAPYVSLTAEADSVRLADFMPGGVQPGCRLGFKARVETEGLDLRTSASDIVIGGLYIHSDADSVRLDSLEVSLCSSADGLRRLTLKSDIARAEATGDFDMAGLAYELRRQASLVMPALAAPPDARKGGSRSAGQQATLDAEIFGADHVIRFFVPQLHLPDSLSFRSQIDSRDGILWAQMATRRVAFGGFECGGLKASVVGNDGRADVTVFTDSVRVPLMDALPYVRIDAAAENDRMTADLRWKNEKDDDEDRGLLGMDARVENDGGGRVWRVGVDNSRLPVGGGAWAVDSCRFTIADKRVEVGNFRAFQGDSYVRAQGTASASESDTLRLWLNKIVLEDLLKNEESTKYSLAGDLSLGLAVSSVTGAPSFDASAEIDRLFVNGDKLEHLVIAANNDDAARDSVKIGLAIVTGGRPRAKADGFYDAKAGYLSLPFDIDSLSTGFLNFYLDNCIDSWRGSTSGTLSLHGPVSDLKLDSRLRMNDDNSFRVIQTDVRYSLLDNDSVILSPKSMDFKNIRFTDAKGKKGVFSGSILHDMFSNLDMRLHFDVYDMSILQTDANESPTYYGNIVGSGRMDVLGPTSNIKILIDAATGRPTEFTVSPNAKSSIGDVDYVHAMSQARPADIAEILGTGTEASLKLSVTPDAKLTVVVDAANENLLSGRGEGVLTVDIERTGALKMNGRYEINEGLYNFKIFGLVEKKFNIDKGSSIAWSGGDPYDADIDVTASYTVRAALSTLGSIMSYDGNSDLKAKVPVQCKIILTGKLTSPNTSFDVVVPSTSNRSQTLLDTYVNTQEEKMRQVVSLLATGSFYSLDDGSQQNQSYISNTFSELISSKVSGILSQNERNIDFNVRYSSGDEVANEEYEFGVSKQVGSKVFLSGNIGYGRDVSGASQDEGSVIGDFDISVKLNDRGNIRAKAYTHSNNDVIYETSPTTQGIGVSFEESFDSFRDLFRAYWRKLFHRRRDDEATKDDDESRLANTAPQPDARE